MPRENNGETITSKYETEIWRTNEKGGYYYINNLVLKIPSNPHTEEELKSAEELQKRGLKFSLQRQNYLEAEMLDTPYSLICGSQNKHSALYLSQNVGQFFKTIDQVLSDLGIMDEVTDFNTIGSEEKEQTRLERLPIILVPVYEKLRDKGYTWTDICS